jgi:hypothetical protein
MSNMCTFSAIQIIDAPDDLKAIWICHECKLKFVFIGILLITRSTERTK